MCNHAWKRTLVKSAKFDEQMMLENIITEFVDTLKNYHKNLQGIKCICALGILI